MLVQQLVNGLTLGAIYSLIALGYTLVYGILTMINFAHSEVLMLGAFAALLGLLHVKARYEERLLRSRFVGYEAYAARTPRFVPRWPQSGG